MHVSTVELVLMSLMLSQFALAQEAKPPVPSGQPPRVIMLETTPALERSEGIRKFVGALEKEGIAKRSKEDRAGTPVDLYAEIHARPDVDGEKLRTLFETMKALSIGRVSLAVATTEGTNRVIITCPADVAWLRVRSIQEELEKLKDFTFDLRVAANNDPVTATGPVPSELKEDLQYFSPTAEASPAEASPPTAADAGGPLAPASATPRYDASSDVTPGTSVIRVFRLEHAVARDVGPVIEQLFLRSEYALSLVADERTNSLIVRGDPELLAEVEALVIRLDESSSVRGAGSASFQNVADDVERVPGSPMGPAPLALDFGVPTDAQTFSFYFGIAEASVADLRQQYSSLEKRTKELATRLRQAVAGPGAAKRLKGELEDAVRQAFAARQKLQRAELAEFARRMQGIQQSIEMRDRIEKQIIDRRVEVLLNPNVDWGTPDSDAPQEADLNQRSTEAVGVR